jgi:CDP-2,3-bis-(O-geranylgeranyl)-sn-glycerol synthase
LNSPDPLLCSIFLVSAFFTAGLLQTLWLRSGVSRHFAIPVDGGRTIAGRRVFGDNKTWRGFVMMVPAVGGVFMFFGFLRTLGSSALADRLWSISIVEYGLLGCWVGFWFMAAELPNSFVKRWLGIQPGAAPIHRWGRSVCFVVDQFDSIAGGLLALAVVVPTPLLTWLYILAIGPALHWWFNLLLFLLGMKTRAA